MPQFDQFSFFNQVFWFFIFFLSFYYVVSYYLLPIICYQIKFRKKKIIKDNTKKNQIYFEKNNISFFYNNSYQFFYNNFELFFNKKINIYNKQEKNVLNQKPLINKLLQQNVYNLINKKFLFLKKTFINI